MNDLADVLFLLAGQPSRPPVYAGSPQFRIDENSSGAHAVTKTTLGLRAANFWTAEPRVAAGISSDGVASVLVLEADGVLHVGVADPTQANNSGLIIGIDGAASEVIEIDAAVQVEQLTPTLVLNVDTRNARGRTFRAKLRIRVSGSN